MKEQEDSVKIKALLIIKIFKGHPNIVRISARKMIDIY